MAQLHPVCAAPLLPARYDLSEREVLRDLLQLLRLAVRARDPRRLGQVSTMSARIRQRRLPVQHFDVLLNIAASYNAVSISIAPDASSFDLIFDGHQRSLQWSIRAAVRALQQLGTCFGSQKAKGRL